MNLVEELLKLDAKKADELKTGVFKSKRLATLLGSKEPTIDVTFHEVPSRRLNDIVAYQVTKKGEVDFSKTFDAKLMMCVEGVVEPDLKNKDLQKHFEVSNGRELAERLFASEVNELSDAISALSGIGNDEGDEDEIKN